VEFHIDPQPYCCSPPALRVAEWQGHFHRGKKRGRVWGPGHVQSVFVRFPWSQWVQGWTAPFFRQQSPPRQGSPRPPPPRSGVGWPCALPGTLTFSFLTKLVVVANMFLCHRMRLASVTESVQSKEEGLFHSSWGATPLPSALAAPRSKANGPVPEAGKKERPPWVLSAEKRKRAWRRTRTRWKPPERTENKRGGSAGVPHALHIDATQRQIFCQLD